MPSVNRPAVCDRVRQGEAFCLCSRVGGGQFGAMQIEASVSLSLISHLIAKNLPRL